jgi:hypothetical protein
MIKALQACKTVFINLWVATQIFVVKLLRVVVEIFFFFIAVVTHAALLGVSEAAFAVNVFTHSDIIAMYGEPSCYKNGTDH